MKVVILVALTVALASATHWEYSKREFHGDPISYTLKHQKGNEQGFSYRGIYSDSMYEVPENILRTYLPNEIFRRYVPVSMGYIRNPFVPESILKSYLPEDLYQIYVPHVQVPTPILKSYLPETVFRNYMPYEGQIQKPFYQIPIAVAETYLPKDIFKSYIPIASQFEQGKGQHVDQQGVFKTLHPYTAVVYEPTHLSGDFKGLHTEDTFNWRSGIQGHQFQGAIQPGVNNNFEFSLPIYDSPIIQLPVIH